MRYTFGDTLTANERLKKIADFFNPLAASWFFPNTISVWNTEEYVKCRLKENEKARISDEMLRISELKSDKSTITWRMRRIILCCMKD
jgi:hypothetical protein